MQAFSDNAHGVVNTAFEASMRTATPEWWGALRWFDAQYSVVEYTKKKAAICGVFGSASHPGPARRLNSSTREKLFVKMDYTGCIKLLLLKSIII